MKKVFIIDDDELYQLVLKRIVKKVVPAAEVVSFWNGEEALEAFTNIISNNDALPDVVFLDINLPVLDGWQFLEGLEGLKPDIRHELPVYMISTSLDYTDKQKAQNNSIVRRFLTKPLSKEEVAEILNF